MYSCAIIFEIFRMSFPLPSLPRYVCLGLGLFTVHCSQRPYSPVYTPSAVGSLCSIRREFLLQCSLDQTRYGLPSPPPPPSPPAASAVGSSRILPKSGKVRAFRSFVRRRLSRSDWFSSSVGTITLYHPIRSSVSYCFVSTTALSFFSHGYALGGARVGVREAFEQGGVDRG